MSVHASMRQEATAKTCLQAEASARVPCLVVRYFHNLVYHCDGLFDSAHVREAWKCHSMTTSSRDMTQCPALISHFSAGNQAPNRRLNSPKMSSQYDHCCDFASRSGVQPHMMSLF